MAKITVTNVLKIIDISHNELSMSTIKHLQDDCEATYKDRVLKEDIYNAEVLEEYEGENDDIRLEFIQIQNLLNIEDASYFRVIFP